MTNTPDLAAEAAADIAPAYSGAMEGQFAAALLAPLVPMADALLDERGALWGVFAGTIADDRLLGWGAQWAGFYPVGATEAELRDLDVIRTRWYRGSPAASIATIQLTLTGTKTVTRRERYLAADGWGVDNAYNLYIRTRTSETPDPEATLAAALSQKPAGIVLDFAVAAGQDWQDVINGNANWTAVGVAFPTWQDVIEN